MVVVFKYSLFVDKTQRSFLFSAMVVVKAIGPSLDMKLHGESVRGRGRERWMSLCPR
jgi:hypothetical protein